MHSVNRGRRDCGSECIKLLHVLFHTTRLGRSHMCSLIFRQNTHDSTQADKRNSEELTAAPKITSKLRSFYGRMCRLFAKYWRSYILK